MLEEKEQEESFLLRCEVGPLQYPERFLKLLLNRKAPTHLCRRWQGLALAVWGAAKSAAASASPGSIPASYLMLSSFLLLPHCAELALATSAGRNAVLQVCERMLEVREEGATPVHSAAFLLVISKAAYVQGPSATAGEYAQVRVWRFMEHAAATNTQDPALTLARCGVLARLVCWAAEYCCVLPGLEVGWDLPDSIY